MDEMGDVLFVRSVKNDVEESSMNEDDAWDDTALIEAYDHAVNLAKDEVMRRMGLIGVEESPSSSVRNTATEPKKHSHKKWNKTKNGSKKNQWSVGDPCRCVYAEDGLSYEACIIQINPTGTCIVKYVGYDNEEEVAIKSLQFSHGHAARLRQAGEARTEMEFADSGNNGDDIDQESTSTAPGNKYKSKSNQRKHKEQECLNNSRFYDKSRPAMRCNMTPPHIAQHSSMSSLPMMFPPPPPPHVLASHEFISDSDALSNMLMSWYMSGFHTGFYQGVMQNEQHRGSKCNCCHNKH